MPLFAVTVNLDFDLIDRALPRGILIKKLIARDLSSKISSEKLSTVSLAHELRLNVELGTISKILD